MGERQGKAVGRIAIAAFCAAGMLTGCLGSSGPREERRLSVLRPLAEPREEVTVKVSREKLKAAVSNEGALRAIRPIQTYSSGEAREGELPQYRIFGVVPGSAYDLVGLKNKDVLVAVNDRLLANGGVIEQIFSLLPGENEVSIELVRANRAMLLRCEIVD